MKKIFFSISFVIISLSVFAQSSNQQDDGERLARKIAKSMKDSLDLTGAQMNQLYDINFSIHNQKKQARLQYTNRDSVGRALQRIEGTRDSLYRVVIPMEKFDAYKRKKRNLVNNNQ